MKRILLIGLLLLTFLAVGCVFNLSGFIMPDDLEFLAVVESLDTPEKICTYMLEYFTYVPHYFYTPSPYTTWKLGEGDCNDLADFARFIANYHGYETYQILVYFKGASIRHALTAYREDGKLTYSNVRAYKPIFVDTFGEVVSHFFETCFEYERKGYQVYDWDNNLVEKGD